MWFLFSLLHYGEDGAGKALYVDGAGMAHMGGQVGLGAFSAHSLSELRRLLMGYSQAMWVGDAVLSLWLYKYLN